MWAICAIWAMTHQGQDILWHTFVTTSPCLRITLPYCAIRQGYYPILAGYLKTGSGLCHNVSWHQCDINKRAQRCLTPLCPSITTLLHYLVWLSLLSVQKKKPRVMAAIAIINSIVPILIFILLLVYNICTQLRGILQTIQFLRHKSKHFPWTSQTFRQKSFRFLQNFKSQHRSNRLHCYKCDKKRQAPKPRCLSPWLWVEPVHQDGGYHVLKQNRSKGLQGCKPYFILHCQPFQ